MELLNRQFIEDEVYPEKVLQFGTGVLLRGLPDYFIEKANRAGIFEGSIVVVKSTNKGDTDQFKQQDNVYTIHVKGIEKGRDVQDHLVVSAISRVMAASDDWEAILSSARNPALAVVISNTTEVGIVLDKNDNVFATPPRTFPAKLTAVLLERFRAFDGAEDKGLVILPTELIDKNGETLREMVLALAEHNQLGKTFIDWLINYNHFCNTLVDRIVPGSLEATDREQAERRLGYKDELAIMVEPFCLWAIESSDPRVAEVLSFAKTDNRMVITPDISKFKELKLRLLNGSHTFACGLAMLAGFDTVKEAMADRTFSAYMNRLMHNEIIPTLTQAVGIAKTEAEGFANQVIDRFRNPYLEHKWGSIGMNYTEKMRMRNLATIERFLESADNNTPDHMAVGFAGYLMALGGTDPFKLLADWEDELVSLGDFLPTVKDYTRQLQQYSPLNVLKGLNNNKGED